MKNSSTLWLVVKITAAAILLQTLFFKFSAAPESVYIFSSVGIEPWGRIGTGILELITAVLILIPRTSWIGALLSVGLMLGAVATHLFIIGIDVLNDGGKLFALAIITLACSVAILLHEKVKIITFVKLLA